MRTRLIVLTMVLCWLLVFYHIDRRDLWNSHEGRAGQDAQSILDGRWSNPPALYDGRPEVQKPPLYYWCVAGVGAVRGRVDALAVRLPSALAAFGCVTILVWFGRRQGRPLLGLLAGLMLISAHHFTWSARTGRIDVPLTFCVTVAVLLLTRPTRKTRLPAYLALAAAVLLKGPIGLILPLAILGLHGLTQRSESPLRFMQQLGWWWGLPLVLVVVSPVYLWLNYRTDGEFFRVFFWYHNVERGLGSETLRSHPWWFYGPQLLLDLLPWSLMLPLALFACWKHRWLREDSEARLGLCWLLAVLFLLSCARFKRADYLLPAYPGAFLFLGAIAERWYLQSERKRSLATAFLLVPVVVCVGWMWYVDIHLPAGEPQREYATFAGEVRARTRESERICFFRTESHTPAFHLGKPIRVLVRWEDLDALLEEEKTLCVVMPPTAMTEMADWTQRLPGREVESLCSTDREGIRHEKPLVLVRVSNPQQSARSTSK